MCIILCNKCGEPLLSHMKVCPKCNEPIIKKIEYSYEEQAMIANFLHSENC